MHRQWQIILGIFSVLMMFSLAGCGFVDVSSITPTVKKINVLVIGPATYLKNAQIAKEIASAPAGLNVTPLVSDGTQSSTLPQMVERSFASAIVLIQPTPELKDLAVTHPNARFYWINTTQGLAPKNVTVLSPNLGVAASVAGYIAGGTLTTQEPLYVVSGQALAKAASTSVVTAVYSGEHAAFANSPVVYAGSPTSAGAAKAGVWVVVGTISANDQNALIQAQQKVIPLFSQNLFQANQILASYSDIKWVQSGLQQAFSALVGNQAATSLTSVPMQVQIGTSTSKSSETAVRNYEHLILTGVLSPQGFREGTPSIRTAKLLQLPVPSSVAG